MSYAYEFSDEGIIQFRSLDSWLAEETLDELEAIAENPPLTRRRIRGGFVYDFVRQRGSERLYVFLTIVPDREKKLLRVNSVGVHSRQTSGML